MKFMPLLHFSMSFLPRSCLLLKTICYRDSVFKTVCTSCKCNNSQRRFTNSHSHHATAIKSSKAVVLTNQEAIKPYLLVTRGIFGIKLPNTIKNKLYNVGIVLPDKQSKAELYGAAQVLLNNVYMKVPFKDLRETAGLEDSFSMWLKIVYIHLWFLISRLQDGGRDGKIVIQHMLTFLWEDVTERVKELEDELQQSLKSKSLLREYSNGLYVFFALLDEGMLSNDAMLASTLWSFIYRENSIDTQAWHLENLVHYMRLTNARLSSISSEKLMSSESSFEWTFPKEISV